MGKSRSYIANTIRLLKLNDEEKSALSEGTISPSQTRSLLSLNAGEKREKAVPLEEDEYFVADMIGMKVITEDGTEFGTLSDVMETGANDVYVIDSKEHGEVLMPAIKECVLNVDMESGIITVHLMNGLI